jgi:hypothetical protein
VRVLFLLVHTRIGVWRCLSFDELADKSHAFLA